MGIFVQPIKNEAFGSNSNYIDEYLDFLWRLGSVGAYVVFYVF